LLKIKIEDSLKENSKGQKPLTDKAKSVDGTLKINSNFFLKNWLDRDFLIWKPQRKEKLFVILVQKF
jgi:hypothetical protein